MKQFEILEHRGDFKIKVLGKDKKELFLNALLGMESGLCPDFRNRVKHPVLTDKHRVLNRFRRSRHIKVSSPDINALLVDFLSEVLYLIQTNKEIYEKIKFLKFSDKEIQAELFGKKIKRFGEDIKAVTYHGLDIHRREDGVWESELLFDI